MMATPGSDTTTSVYFDTTQDPFGTVDQNENLLGAIFRSPDVDDRRNDNAQAHSDDEARDADEVIDPDGAAGWLPAVDVPDKKRGNTRSVLKKKPKPRGHSPSASMSSAKNGQVESRSASAAGRPSTSREGAQGPTIVNGIDTLEPDTPVEHDDSMQVRIMSPDVSQTPNQKSKTARSDSKYGKRVATIIKEEADVEKDIITMTLNELAELQKMQRAAVKREAEAHAAHTRARNIFHQNEAAFLAARLKYEASQAQLESEAAMLEMYKTNAREAKENVREKTQELDRLKVTQGEDEREREARLVHWTGRRPFSRWKGRG